MPVCMFCNSAKGKPLKIKISYHDQYEWDIIDLVSDKSTQISNGVLIDRCLENGRFQQNYTIDRRCYITDEQKKEFPYNAIVGVSVDGGWCTGTLVKDNADELYVYTATHCVKNPNAPITVTLQDGTTFSATTKYDKMGSDEYKDVAVLKIPWKNKISLEFIKRLPLAKMGQFNSDDIFNVIGYGSLAILNDKTIHDIKQKYAKHMDIDENEIESDNEIYKKFEKFLRDYTELFEDDKNLKGSFDCSLRDNASVWQGRNQTDCQVAQGSSGGPVFDKDNNLVAVLTRGYGLQNNRYATTSLGGVEPVSDVQNQIYDYKLMVYSDYGCYIETKDEKHNIVGDQLCEEKKPPRSFDNSWWVAVKGGKTTWGVSHCYNKDKYPGATSINFSIIGMERGEYCWCRFINQLSKTQEQMAYFSGVVYDDNQTCVKNCAYACAKWFLSKD